MDALYKALQASHSGFRWIALILLVLTVVQYLIKWQNSADYQKKDKTIYTIALSLMHLQLLIGIALYFVSPKVQFGAETMSVRILRFFTVEHAFLMIAAVVLFTIGSAKIKKKDESVAKFKTGFIFSLITLLLILIGIPWPFQALGAGWF